MNKLAIRILIGLSSFVWSSIAFADSPPVNVKQKFDGTAFEWILQKEGPATKLIIADSSGNPVGQYDISDCMFCTGEDDNCESDGIKQITVTGSSVALKREPVLAVICHVGAHSQRLQIMAPWRNSNLPAHSATGAYFLTPEFGENGLSYKYDVDKGDGTFVSRHRHWP